MAEYRIITKIDPAGVTSGRAKVRQELEGLTSDVKRAGEAGTTAMDKMTAAEFRAAGGVEGLTKKVQQQGVEFKNLGAALKGAIKAQNDAEAAARRVEDAVDSEAAAQRRLNALLKDAKLALDAGTISQQRYNQVQQLANDGLKRMEGVAGRTRAGLTQLSFQVGDISQGLALGTRASTLFAQQSGQVIQSLQVMGGEGNAFIKFLGGPWGIALATAAVVLGPFVGKLFEGNDALGDGIDKLKEDAKQTEIDRAAKERYTHSEEGLVAAVRDRLRAMDESIKKSRTQGEQDNLLAQSTMNVVRATREQTRAMLEQALAEQRATHIRSAAVGPRGEIASLGAPIADARVEALQRLLAENDKALGDAETLYRRSLTELANEAAKRLSDPVEQVRQKYEGPNGLITLAQREAEASKSLTSSRKEQVALTTRLRDLYRQEREEVEKAQKAERERTKTISDGVARFKSREQAIGIAGNELLRAGLNVGENAQFGGVKGHHPGMGDAAHGRFAIDVNEGSGVVEANVPEIKARFDALARSYQKRGYRVLWNGQVYEAFGNGPSRPIPGGQNQHHDHMHVEAPGIIVGKPTQSSLAAAEMRDQKQEATRSENASDFINRIVNEANAKAQPDRASQLRANIGRTLADFETRFNRAASPDEVKKITGALTAAEARTVADHFKQAYVDPLDLLREGLGKTSVERAISNAKLKEAADLGRALTPVEEKQIENRFRLGDQLEREGKILTDIRQPLEDYRQTIAALVGLLNKGEISQRQFNNRVAELNSPVRQLISGAPAGFGQPGGVNVNDPNARPGEGARNYGTFEDAGQAMEENARYSAELDQYEKFRQRLQDAGVNYDALEEAAHQRHVDNLNKIDQARQQTTLSAAESIAGSLVSIAGDAFGKQSGIYRAMFAAEKAFTIAKASLALYQAVSNALALPFPANLPAIAQAFAAGAQIVAAIKGISASGFEGGGYTGDLGRSTPAGVVHGQEFVVNADATSRHRAMLEAMNSGRFNATPRSVDSGASHAPRPPVVNIQNFAPGVEFETARGATVDEVVVIARKVAREEAPGAVASDMGRANSRTSKALGQHFGVPRKRA